MAERSDRTHRDYAIVYFGPLLGGFAKRMNLLAEVLGTEGRVDRVHSLAELWRFLRAKEMTRGDVSVLVYSSLMAPLVAILKCFRPSVRVYYMVRGDEATWAGHAGRNLRARLAGLLQKLIVLVGCRFVFASEDLRDLFAGRLGRIGWWGVLPNTLGKSLPDIRPFDGRVAVVGDFGSVKNIEYVIDSLDGGEFRVDVYGNRSFPERANNPAVRAHGFVADLKRRLRDSSVVVLSSISEGFPNVLLDALEAGCAVVVHNEFPFRRLPVAAEWRFDLNPTNHNPDEPGCSPRGSADLPSVLRKLRSERADFKKKNGALVRLVESDWTRRVLEVFA